MAKVSNIKSDLYLIAGYVLTGRRDSLKFIAVIFVQLFLALMDLVGVSVIGLIGALSISGVQSREPGAGVSQILKILYLDDKSFQVQVALLGAFAAITFLTRTVLSIFLTKKILRFLGRRSADIGIELTRKVLSQKLINLQKWSEQDYLFGLTTGVSNLALGVIGSVILLFADLILLTVLTFGLVFVDLGLAFGTVFFFVIVGLALYLHMQRKASALGQSEAKFSISTAEYIVEALSTYREAVVKNRRGHYVLEIGKSRTALTETLAELSFMPHVSKYILESALVVGALLISAIQFLAQDATQAIATLTIFLAAGTRIAPAILRIQQSAIQVSRSLGAATPTLNLLAALESQAPVTESETNPAFVHIGFSPNVKLENVSFSYPDAGTFALDEINLEIKAGELVAIVGPSGAGKTTLVDVLVGVIDPDKGSIEISDTNPSDAFAKWPGAIAYVPQLTFLANGSIRSNVALGFSNTELYATEVLDAIKQAQLSDLIEALPARDLSLVGDGGSNLSGGQIQRIGIARAMFTKPKLIILDEATSSLDGETEANISSAFQSLKGEVTVILIAHRLSTVRDADTVVYLDGGKIIASGTFEDVRAKVPNFDRQASLMGL